MAGSLPQEPIRIQPVKVNIENLTGHIGSGYRFSPLHQPHLMLPGVTVAGGGGQRQGCVLEAAAEAAGRQISAVESHCDEMLRQIKVLCHKVPDIIRRMCLLHSLG